MNEPEFCKLARQYLQIIDRQNDMKPSGWSQSDHTREFNLRMDLRDKMRAALKETTPA